MGSYETNGSSSQNVLYHSLWEKPEVLTLQGFQISLLQSKAEPLVDGGDLRVRKATLPAEGKGRWDGVLQRDKEGARSTEITGLERPEVGRAESRRHVTGDRNSCGGGRACL